jgi:hypothetical protein
MCVITNEVKLAARDIFVWKVFVRQGKRYYPCFRTPCNEEVAWASFLTRTRTPFTGRIKVELNSTIAYLQQYIKPVAFKEYNTPALSFASGMGYCCFHKKMDAKSFIEMMYEVGRMLAGCAEPVKMVIPKGAFYGEGVIGNGYIGSGMPAIRAERLKRAK